jgi:alanine racemase
MLNLASSQRIWAEVNLSNLRHNYAMAKELSPGKEAICVVKADAYGAGAVPVARALMDAGADRFAVATPVEALELRKAGCEGFLLILGALPPSWAEEMAGENVSLCISSLEQAQALSSALSSPVSCHVKIDTGMSRLGLDWKSAPDEVQRIARLPKLRVSGAFSHFAAAGDSGESEFSRSQYEKFAYVCESLKDAGMDGLTLHCNCTDAILNLETRVDNAIRPGILLHGYGVGPEAGLKPVTSVRAAVVQAKWLEDGTSVSYGRRWTAAGRRRIAVISAGYADGIMRAGTNRLSVIINGQRAKQVGTVCMDMIMADVTDVEGCEPGSVATIIGQDGSEAVTADDVARAYGTIPYEVLCAVSKRVPRYYL